MISMCYNGILRLLEDAMIVDFRKSELRGVVGNYPPTRRHSPGQNEDKYVLSAQSMHFSAGEFILITLDSLAIC